MWVYISSQITIHLCNHQSSLKISEMCSKLISYLGGEGACFGKVVNNNILVKNHRVDRSARPDKTGRPVTDKARLKMVKQKISSNVLPDE